MGPAAGQGLDVIRHALQALLRGRLRDDDDRSSYRLIHLLTHHATILVVLLPFFPWVFNGHDNVKAVKGPRLFYRNHRVPPVIELPDHMIKMT